MAWPNTPLTSYVANSTPAIKASDLNAFQTAINGVYTGVLSIKGMYIDGTGGSAVAATAGTVRVSKLVASAGAGAAPQTVSVPLGEIPRGSVLLAWGYVSPTGGVAYGQNIYDCQLIGISTYEITLNVAPSSVDAFSVQAMVFSGVPGVCYLNASNAGALNPPVITAGRLIFQIITTDLVPTASPYAFHFTVHGE